VTRGQPVGGGSRQLCGTNTTLAARNRVAVPLVQPEEEFRRSFDAFPLEYSEILRTHERVFGPSPFDGATLSTDDLRRACETQIKSHLLHLREGYMAAGGRPADVAELMTRSAPAFAALLRSLARLAGASTRDRAEATREGARTAGLPGGLVSDLLALEQTTSVPPPDPTPPLPRVPPRDRTARADGRFMENVKSTTMRLVFTCVALLAAATASAQEPRSSRRRSTTSRT
jgi:hypothetical protein